MKCNSKSKLSTCATSGPVWVGWYNTYHHGMEPWMIPLNEPWMITYEWTLMEFKSASFCNFVSVCFLRWIFVFAKVVPNFWPIFPCTWPQNTVITHNILFVMGSKWNFVIISRVTLKPACSQNPKFIGNLQGGLL